MRDLLAAADHDQVDVVDGLLQRVALDVLGQRELGAAVELEAQQDVGVAAQRQADLTGGQREVARRLAVAVDDGGNLAGATGAAGAAFAELGALLGADTDLGHGGRTPRTLAISNRWRGNTQEHGGPRAETAGATGRALRAGHARLGDAAEQVGDRAVGEDRPDGPGEQRRDGQHGQLVELRLRRRSAACR